MISKCLIPLAKSELTFDSADDVSLDLISFSSSDFQDVFVHPPRTQQIYVISSWFTTSKIHGIWLMKKFVGHDFGCWRVGKEREKRIDSSEKQLHQNRLGGHLVLWKSIYPRNSPPPGLYRFRFHPSSHIEPRERRLTVPSPSPILHPARMIGLEVSLCLETAREGWRIRKLSIVQARSRDEDSDSRDTIFLFWVLTLKYQSCCFYPMGSPKEQRK